MQDPGGGEMPAAVDTLPSAAAPPPVSPHPVDEDAAGSPDDATTSTSEKSSLSSALPQAPITPSLRQEMGELAPGEAQAVMDEDPLVKMGLDGKSTTRSSTQLLDGLAKATIPEGEREEANQAYQRYGWNTSGLFNFNFSALEGILHDVSQALQGHDVQISRVQGNQGAISARLDALENKLDSVTKALRMMDKRQGQLVKHLDTMMNRRSSSSAAPSSSRPPAGENKNDGPELDEEGEGGLTAEDLIKTLKQTMGLGKDGSRKTNLDEETEPAGGLEGERRGSHETKYIEERTFNQFKAETHSQMADLTLALTRLHKTTTAAPSKKELRELSDEMKQEFEGMKKTMDRRFVEMTMRSDELLSEDLRKLHVWMAEQEQAIKERYQSILSKLDLCVKRDSFTNVATECGSLQDQVTELKGGLQKTVQYISIIEQKTGIKTWKGLIKERLNRVTKLYFNRWIKIVEREREFERLAKELMRVIFRTMFTRLTGNAFEKWKIETCHQRELEEQAARGRECMSRCLNAIGRRDYFKAFNQWRRVLMAQKQLAQRDDLMTLVEDVGGGDPIFVARMLVNEIQMIKSIDFAKHEESRREANYKISEEITAMVQEQVTKLQEEDNTIRELIDYNERQVKEELADHMQLLLGHQEKMKDLDKVLLQQVGEAADGIRRTVSESFATLSEQMQVVDAAIYDIRAKTSLVEAQLAKIPPQIRNGLLIVDEKVDNLATTVRNDITSVAHKHEQRSSELRAILATLQSDLKALQKEAADMSKAKDIMMQTGGVLNEDGPDASLLYKACSEYESAAKDHNYVPSQFDDSVVQAIGQYAKMCGEWIVGRVDLEALKRYAGATSSDDLLDMDESLANKRVSFVEDCMTQFDRTMRRTHSTSNAVKLEARSRFRSRVRDTLLQAMVGKDQMTVVVTNSRATRVPACVACDRPLTAKQPKAAAAREAMESEMHSTFHQTHGHIMRGTMTGATPPAVSTTGGCGGGFGRPGSPVMTVASTNQVAVLEGDCETGPSVRHGIVEGRSGGGISAPSGSRTIYTPGGGSYVYRGGFKMPRTMHIPPQVLDRLSSSTKPQPQASQTSRTPSSHNHHSRSGVPSAGAAGVEDRDGNQGFEHEQQVKVVTQEVAVRTMSGRPKTAPLPRIASS